MPSYEKQKENFVYFQHVLPELISDPLMIGKHAIVYDSTIKGVFDSFEAAYREACSRFPAGFIVQQIVDEENLGAYSCGVLKGFYSIRC